MNPDDAEETALEAMMLTPSECPACGSGERLGYERRDKHCTNPWHWPPHDAKAKV